MEIDACAAGAGLAFFLAAHHSMFVEEQVRDSLPPQFRGLAAKVALGERVWTDAVPSEARRRYVISISWGTLMFFLFSVSLYNNGRELASRIVFCIGLYGAWTACRFMRRYVDLDCRDLSVGQLIRLMLVGPSSLPPHRGSPTDRS